MCASCEDGRRGSGAGGSSRLRPRARCCAEAAAALTRVASAVERSPASPPGGSL